MNNKSKSISKRVVQCRSLPVIPRNTLKSLVNILSPRVYPFSKMAVKWSDLKWPSRSPKFNFHHLRKISAGFKMAVLTLKLGICWYYIMLICQHRLLKLKYNRTRGKNTAMVLAKVISVQEMTSSTQSEIIYDQITTVILFLFCIIDTLACQWK